MLRLPRQALAMASNGLLRPGADQTYADGDDSAWTGVDWPSLTHGLDVLGRRINVVDGGGEGPPLLFVHGLGGCWQNWLLNLPAFMGSHRVVTLDLPGFGESEMPSEPISIRGYAKTLDGVCDQLGIENPVVVGNSMGGFVAAEMALSFSTRVAKLVLVSAAGLSTEYLQREPLLAVARVWAVAATRTSVRSEPVVRRPRLRRLALQGVVRYPERLSGPLAYELVQGSGRDGFIPALDALMAYSFRDRLARIEMPVLIVWGRNDILVPVGDAARFERLIGENAHRVIFEDTGHLAMLERPSRFNELLAGFIAGEREPELGITGTSSR